MQTQLRILILEDIQVELELLEYGLDKAQLNYQSRCVYTREDFLKALKVFNPHIILSDFNMPQFTEIEALSLVKKHYPFLPFIIITGTLTEERAVEFMKAGADDYIIKDHLNRIVPAIHSALDKKRIKAKRETVIGKICHQFICPAEKDNCPVSDQHLTIDKSERQLLNINKESIPVLKTVNTIRIGDKELLLETIIDLTERKRAEKAIRKSEEKYREIITWAPIGIYQSTPDGKFITVNNSLAGILEYDNVEELFKCNLGTDIYFNQEEW
ncbi:MAG: response regulator [Ignavibacteriales bacterium]|nr:response regulator [Ignavibacteriales bacterium]